VAERAQIIDTGSRWVKAARITIDSPAEAVFDVLADPRRHPEIDGSGTVKASVHGPDRLSLGARFGMHMHLVVPYRIENEVVEYEEGRLIAWRHFYRHRWRYELDPIDAVTTRVTETFDGRTALFPPGLLLIDAYRKNQIAVAKTLVRLQHVVEAGA
jgi:uncharacterized protein YndB with AHSA1/START domain